MAPAAAPDWDAGSYHRLSGPQLAWARELLARVPLDGAETVADVGCGTGRLTRELLARLPAGRLFAVDVSASMLAEASAHLSGTPGRWLLVRADATTLPFDRVLDVAFSSATFHWIMDHDALFATLFRALKPGGRLVAQCGGGPNLERLLTRARRLIAAPEFARHFERWVERINFADAETTKRRLERAGFVDVLTSLEPRAVSFENADAYRDFLRTVCVWHHIEQLPDELRPRFTERLADAAAKDDPPFMLDYWRLNLSGRRPG
jgi:trans-aconitate 2-methyltransferase